MDGFFLEPFDDIICCLASIVSGEKALMILTIFSKVGNVSFFLWLLSEFSLVFRTLCVWVWFFYPDWSLLRLLDIFIKLGKFLAIVCSNIYSASMLPSFKTPIICVWGHLILFYKPLRLYLFSFSFFYSPIFKSDHFHWSAFTCIFHLGSEISNPFTD